MYAKTNPPAFTVACVCLTVVALLLPVTSFAQDRALEEVIVTAQKRAESIQDVPLGITALNAEAIERAGITNTADLVRLAPSLTAIEGTNKQQTSFSIRGIGTSVFSIGVETSVAVIIDDVATVQAGQALANLVDVERVEVLRGPQSTLFGKSASAGLINVTTQPPAEELEGYLELAATDDNEQRVTGSISGPITDDLGFRLTGLWSDLDGYLDNLTYGDDINENKSKAVRGKLRWDVSETIQADLIAYYSKEDSTCCGVTWAALDPDAMLFGVVPDPVAPGITPSDDNRNIRNDNPPDSTTKNPGGSLRLNVDLGEFSLTSITAYDNWKYSDVQDVDLSNVDALGFFTGGAQHGGFVSNSDVETDFFSQEFRLISPSYDKYDYLVGLYYADAKTDRQFVRNPGTTILTSNWDATAETESMAVFGQLNWHFTPDTTLTAGLRWNDEKISIDYINNLAATDGVARNHDSDSAAVGNLSVQHNLQEDVMVYARYAKGYKGQAYNVVTGFTQADADDPVDPETSDAYEIGIKSQFWDQRMQLNATVFYTEYQDFQAQNTVITPGGTFVNKLRNVGEVETQGVELEGVALLGENLTLTFGAAYVDSEIKSFEGAPCYEGQTVATGCVNDTQNLDGEPLPNSPEWKYNLMANYHIELDSLPFYGFVNAGYTWQDDVNFDIKQNPLTVQDSYGVAMASIGISEKTTDQYRVTLFVNNLTDENYRAGIADVRDLFGGDLALGQVLPRSAQRYYGVRLRYSF